LRKCDPESQVRFARKPGLGERDWDLSTALEQGVYQYYRAIPQELTPPARNWPFRQ